MYGPGPQTEGNLVGRLIADHLAGRLPGSDRAPIDMMVLRYVDDVAAAHVRRCNADMRAGSSSLGGENAPQMRVFEIVTRSDRRKRSRGVFRSRCARIGGVRGSARAAHGRPPC